MTKIGIISDTHGHLPEAACRALKSVARIVHAGDIGAPQILNSLAELAPVTAVRGNMDRGRWAAALPQTAVVEVEGTRLFVLHDIFKLDLDPLAAGMRVVVSGHTHQPSITRKNGVLRVNPGSASQPRFGARPSIAVLDFAGGGMNVRIVEFDR